MPLASGPDRERERPRPCAQLTIPLVPKFPLSSPITDEIASPSESDEEERERERDQSRDHEMERNRPFDFLAKMSDKNRDRDWDCTAARRVQVVGVGQATTHTHTASTSSATTTTTSTEGREGSSRRPVGLNLDIPRSTPQTKQTTGPFIDLNDLKVLSKAREEERTAAKLKGILKKGDTKKAKGDTRGFQQLQDDAADMGESRKRASLLDVLASGSRGAKRKVTDRADGISPTDRPIVIGFSVPYDSPELMNGEDENGHEKPKEKELNSAGTQFTFTPPTPSIIVTPAKEDGEDGGFWNHLSPEDIQPRRPRAASSVYSQPSPHLGHAPFDAPPVPALPALYSTGNDSSTLASTARPGITNTVRKRRSMSASVVNEKVDYDAEDEKPAGRPRSNSIDSKKTKFSKPSERLTINTALNARASQGWWNYLLSPLLSASSLLSPKTPTTTKIRPQLPTISTSSTGLTDEWWEEKREWVEKEKDKGIERSYFSPDTPEATMRISSWQRGMNGTNPFADFDWSIDEQGQAKRESQGQNPGEQDQDRGVSMMFSGQRIQGAAAEYYQACAHELFSGTPYFECEGHVCSITLKDKIAVAGGEPSFEDTGEGNRNLLIDVDDMPRSNNLESPASGITSINSSPSDDAGRLSASLNGSRATPSERAGGSPAINSPGADAYGGARGPPTPVQTNPYLEQPREYPPPAQPAPNNIHVESVAAPPPANIHIEAPTAQPSNYHYEAPAPPAQPMALDAPDPYGASRGPAPSPNPFDNPRLYEAPRGSMASHNPLERSGTPTPDPPAQATRTAPAPITMPSPEQTPPPNYGAQAYSPYPRSPESLQSSTDRGAIRMSNVSMPAGPAPAYTPHDNAASSYYPNEPLPPRIRAAPITTDDISHPYNTRTHIEARRRRYEREDAAAHKAGGFWRGRGPFSNKGCFGRSGREGRLRRRWYAAIALFFIAIVVGAILLAVFLTRKGDGTPVQSQWLNLTGYPPIPTGISTIAGPEAQVQKSGCIQPSSLWSCALPREQQGANQPYDADRPNFRVEIRFQNGSYEHSTVPVNASGSLDKREVQLFERGTNQLFNPSPEPPSSDDQVFMGKTTDNTSEPYDGEETPFYITFLSTEHLSSSSNLHKRDSDTDNKNDTSTFPDISSLIPTPPIDSDGTAAPAILHPLPISQPLRLYNRGKDDEHYGFYSYFDKSIFLASDAPLTQGSKNKESDLIGGSTKEDARVRCTWAQTRFKVAVWTREDRIGRRLIDRETNSTKIAGNSTSTSTSTSTKSGNDTSSAWEPTSSATDFTSPGSFPYPVSISLDRHGGDVSKKMVYCYGMEEGMRINGTEKMLQVEDRGWGGEIVNQAPGIFSSGSNPNSTGDDDGEHEDEDKEEHGGYDGGSGGCGCEWVNWVEAV
ncbi:uncharacterized protein BDV17DRAFT_136853 [Aspergillus undulatus]|uniref:uncharacterized protein n=1 Tax=Aspergillus undulatus TaxID=1810928 RepID=UPI003CCDFA69